ncbi:MAG: geranylgeranylglycerol-phosphate geranylgeranyltransferase [Candidatus Aenigmarchaeota archaeon]|nr:geranylgeranylglycerol-phosphate geranylgeranyltransferase [Candidatus Aenigmarchaeota archaeon]
MAVFAVVVGYLLSAQPTSGQEQDYTRLFAAAIAAFLACAAGNVINDYFDHKIDKINAPNRPIPRGAVKRINALIFYVALSASGIALASYVSPQFLGIAAVNFVVLSAYGWRLKRSVHLKNAAVSWLSSSSFIAGGLIENAWIGDMVSLIFVMSFFGTFSREVFKDIEDVTGDKKQGARTLATEFGKRDAVKIASLLTILALVSVMLPYFSGSQSMTYVIATFPGVVLGASAVAFRNDAKKSQGLLKISMYCIVLAFVLTSLIE